MMDPTIITLGCRLNAHESETAVALARKAGLNSAVIVNTCAVTSEAVRQAAQAIRRARRDQPEARIIVTGCAAELEPERFAAMPEVDAVVGSAEKLDAQTYADIRVANGRLVRTGAAKTAGAVTNPGGSVARTRAILAVQNGCDHSCTFCIIPLARGPSRSMPVDAAVGHVRSLVAAGHKEVVLTGVDLTSYRAGNDGSAGLGRLVRTILREVPELLRLRLSSIDPAEVDEQLIEVLAEDKRLMPHLHLSLQAGDDMILKRMKRRHSRLDVIRFTQKVLTARPDAVFGADLIAGFPTETEDMFETTLATIEACRLTYLHVFPYSVRPGTPAARMPQLPAKIVMARAARLRQEGQTRLEGFLAGEVGGCREVLMEKGGIGRTPQFAEVIVEPAPPAGVLQGVRILGRQGAKLIGEPIDGLIRERQAPGAIEVPA